MNWVHNGHTGVLKNILGDEHFNIKLLNFKTIFHTNIFTAHFSVVKNTVQDTAKIRGIITVICGR